MILVKDVIDSIEIPPDEYRYFISICSNWQEYCNILSSMDKVEVLRLLKYLTSERPSSHNLLARAISKFNRLNALKKEDLE